MYFASLLVALLLSTKTLAQGNDTIGSLTASASGSVDISYQWFGEPGHELKNITFELLSGAAEASVVEDILGIHYSENSGTSLSLPGDPAYPAGDYFVRMNATIFNGATQVGNTTALSNTFAVTGPQCALPWTPVSSIADPGYTPFRFEDPSGAIISQQELNGPDSGVGFSLAFRDHTYQINDLSMTVEVFSVDTGFSAGVQTMMRANCTSTNPSNPGSFMLISNNFFVIPSSAQLEQCPANSASASSALPSSPSSASAAGGSSGGPTADSAPGANSAPEPTGPSSAPEPTGPSSAPEPTEPSPSESAPASNGGHALSRPKFITVPSGPILVVFLIITAM